MPFSDNLYSAEDSDDDLGDSQSLSDQLSPTDGYFNRSDIPPNVMVSDPSLDANNTTEAKAREARQEAEAYSASLGRSTPSQAQAVSPSSPSSSEQYTSPRSTSYHFAPPSPLPPHPQSSPVSPRRTYHDLYSERSPLLGGPVGPPPAYSPATPSSASSHQSPLPGRSYSTFPQHQLEEAIPQSMGGPPANEPTESSPLWMRRTRTWKRRAVIQKLLFTLLMLSVAMVIVTSIFRSGHSSHSNNPSKTPSNEPSNPPPDGSPIEQPKRPTTPSDPKQPDSQVPPSVPGPSAPYCTAAKYRDSESAFAFPMDTGLYIKETSDTSGTDGYSISVYGEVRLRPIPQNSPHENYGYYTVYVYTSHPDLAVRRDFNSYDRSLKIRTPRYQKLDTPGPHCISIEVTAWIPEGSQFNEINIETIQLSQRVFEGTNVTVSGLSNFQSITGNIHFPEVDESNPAWRKSPKKKNDYATDETKIDSLPGRFPLPKLPNLPELPDLPALPGMPNYRREFSDLPEVSGYNYSSRRITVSTVSGSISGGYPLYDYLGITSSSGSVNINVSPQKILPEKPAPAELEVETKSSSIHVTFPLHGPAWMLPPRDYITSVKAISGSLHGSYITGSKGDWSTESGSVNIEALPIIEISRDDKNEFHTYTSSGSSHINLLEPIFIPKRAPVFVDKEPPAVPDQAHIPFVPIGNKDPYKTLPSKAEESVEESSTLSKLRSLISSHTSRSGTVQLSYPSAWEGTIQATTVTGSINVKGSDIEIIKDGRRDWVRKEVIARKPKGKDIDAGAVVIESTTGSVNFSA